MSAATRSLDLTPVSHILPHAQATRAAMPRPGAPKQAGPAASTPPGQGGHYRGGALALCVCMDGIVDTLFLPILTLIVPETIT